MTPQGVGQWDVAVVGEKIVSVGLPDARAEAGRIVDAKGKIVVPGGVDVEEQLPRGHRAGRQEDHRATGPPLGVGPVADPDTGYISDHALWPV